jgi:1-acyl-sn-glycerol-3-phosphate acyltransferase
MLSVLRLLLLSVYSVIASCLGALLGVLRPFNPNNTSLCARLFAAPSQWLLRINVETELEHLDAQTQACVIIANHQSNYDLFVLGGVVPSRTVSLGKKSLKWIPVFGQLYWLAGNVLIDRSNARKARQTMLTTTETLQKRQTSIWVFPEGTRNAGPELLPFKKGAFQMAIAAGAPIVPVCVSRYTQTLNLNRWDSGQVRVRALPAIPTAGLSLEDMPALIEHCRTRMQACIDELDEELEQRLAAAQPL